MTMRGHFIVMAKVGNSPWGRSHALLQCTTIKALVEIIVTNVQLKISEKSVQCRNVSFLIEIQWGI